MSLLANSPPRTEAELTAAAEPIQSELRKINSLRETSPARYVEASVAAAERLASVADEFRSVSQSVGLRMEAMSQLMKTADFTRLRLHDPRRAIALYERAAALHSVQYPDSKGLAMNEQIADIYEYDLKDFRAAASALRAIRRSGTDRSSGRRDYDLWGKWYQRWIDAELSFLEDGKQFTGEITSDDLAGFTQTLMFRAGAETTNGDPLGADLNIYSLPATLSVETKDKVLGLPASHSMFLKTWMFASRFRTAEDARQWLMKNDQAGFWRACLLTLTAEADRFSPTNGSAGKMVSMLARTSDRAATGFALLSREYAKNHVIPKLAAAGP